MRACAHEYVWSLKTVDDDDVLYCNTCGAVRMPMCSDAWRLPQGQTADGRPKTAPEPHADTPLRVGDLCNALKRINALSEQAEAQAVTIASLSEDVDVAKANTLRAHQFINDMCDMLDAMRHKTRGL